MEREIKKYRKRCEMNYKTPFNIRVVSIYRIKDELKEF
jgi:hypothetical protein